MSQLGIVLRFEFLGYAKRKSFLALTLGLMLVVAVILFWPRISDTLGFGASPAPDPGLDPGIQIDPDDGAEGLGKIAFIDEAGGAAGTAAEYSRLLGDFVPVQLTRQQAEALVEDGTYASAVIFTGPLSYLRIVRNAEMYDSFSYQLEAAMLDRYQRTTLAALGVSDRQAAELLSAAVTGETMTTASGKDQMQNFFYTYLLIFLLYFAIILYGQFVASSVATEKSTRAMELLITSARPGSLMFGKVLGAGLAGLSQLVLILGTATLCYRLNLSYYADSYVVRAIFDIPLEMLLYTLLFFLLGFFIYAFLYAALASLVSRMEDLPTAVLPITFLFVGAFMVVMFSMASGNVDSLLMRFCSYLPLTSPMAMFTRIAMGEVAPWQVALSVGLLALSTLGIGLLAASIYRLGVLLYGNPPKLGQILRMLRTRQS